MLADTQKLIEDSPADSTVSGKRGLRSFA